MKIYFKDIPEGGLTLEGKVPAADYGLPLDQYKDWKTIEYRLFVQILGQECLVTGSLKTELKVPCARCLEPLPLEIHIKEFQQSYPIGGASECIDLTQEIREDILLDLPLAPKCQLDAKSRCPITRKSYAEQDNEFAELNREDVWGILDTLKPKSSKKTLKKRKKE